MPGRLTTLRRLAQYLVAACIVSAVAALPNPLRDAGARVQEQAAKPHIAVFSLTNATLQNMPPLLTSNKARQQHGLPLLTASHHRTRGLSARSQA